MASMHERARKWWPTKAMPSAGRSFSITTHRRRFTVVGIATQATRRRDADSPRGRTLTYRRTVRLVDEDTAGNPVPIDEIRIGETTIHIDGYDYTVDNKPIAGPGYVSFEAISVRLLDNAREGYWV